ncbi:undecaprenyldiphospho-muramoylpentapeptide beta-N-acetylglucosaminyltransferase [Lactobacillus acetotolerans]|jgi:UDP-N-acetylglucosamine--N-acetylmuramyl-(pentapeptide) pyrophosphoryl-undecaprenol N-acetylglucosamine transferase|uniref:UDP-N-acetylglucosamine--N-acetylmuramyl-(pentapeptide) pyrophosphoryl-undecaprenol N-acetylglucosamine transferase n=1 Tax=Lactobacillus acetotolerans TaxID=1600 RepID=A0A353U9B9_9LACO|nr:undecaprenyldiphospho-muramoylpentapeptide beta-N-acetylglucosaminyltransferase [Lactobacillus acetotolerans]KRN42024.1 acetylglucosaminyltransferase [Lactobacillus acetotolerans DSM 20749 = JCM 3825]QFG51423.1 undecaprenyldiphospho-muramoylpentapeptide beta-N-acetylglucosaminyltransferase [Lactobacillus acetotolerans]QJD73380.1 undecaprenyldiphospho-muramoylpentapeptide beta-N-acetylglucosaminyltransferase [Lactobacillus acetotolerans]GGV08155.1 UDP-N-acetylglucosamine--N-acetylmuramyl-(pen
MRVIFTGGGTGGHIYPIMAIIERLKQRKISTNDEILFVGTKKGLESKIVPAAGVNFKTIRIQGFNRKHLLKNFETIELFIRATKKAKEILRDFKPDVVVGTGGYVSGAMVYEAAKMHIPTMIHESNSVVGVANKFLGHYVDKICYTFDDAANQFSEKKKLVKTGNPRSQQVLSLHEKEIDLQSKWGLNPKIPTVLVFGGSRGALAINRIMLKSLLQLKKKPYQIIWATGTYYYDAVQKKLKDIDYGQNIKILPYIQDMPALLPEMTCVVSRSGATSIAEFTALGVPAILIPSPNVTHNHQMKNAVDLEKAGAALVIPENDLNPNNFISSIDHILLDEKYAEEMSKASKALGVPNASDQVIKVMEEISR